MLHLFICLCQKPMLPTLLRRADLLDPAPEASVLKLRRDQIADRQLPDRVHAMPLGILHIAVATAQLSKRTHGLELFGPERKSMASTVQCLRHPHWHPIVAVKLFLRVMQSLKHLLPDAAVVLDAVLRLLDMCLHLAA